MDEEFACTQSILKVERDIAKTEREIDEVVEELKSVDPADAERLQYLRKKEEQLRKKEEQLRKKEEQLRKKEEQLREEKAGSTLSIAVIPAFLRLLSEGGISRPKERVLAKIQASFASQLLLNIHSVDAAMHFYRTIDALPSTFTMNIVEGQADVSISGPLSQDKPKLLAGVRANGTAVVIKLLFPGLDDARPLEVREGEIEHEVKCCTKLALANRGIALVPSEVVMLDAPQEFAMQTNRRGRFRALLMPRFLDSVARGPTFPRMVIAREARRLFEALQYMHRVAGFVHMDVKGDNVFFDNSSGWFLGDFGSACVIGDKIRTSTPTFYHAAIDGVAHPKYDWFMLLVLLLIEMGEKDKWSLRFMNSGQGRVSYDKVMREAESAMSDESYPPELQSVISDIKDMYQSSTS